MRIVSIVFMGWLAISSVGSAAPKPLPLLPTEWTARTVAVGVESITTGGGRMYLLENGTWQIIETPYAPDAKTREERFGRFANMIRHPIGNLEGGATPAALSIGGSSMLVMDGARLGVKEIEMGKWSELSVRGTPWDMIRPARDRGGEGTTREIAATRDRLRKQFAAAAGQGARFSGFKEVPASWGQDGAEHVYLMTSRMPDFPVMLMGCLKTFSSERNTCVAQRVCPVTGLSGEARKRGFGAVAVSAKRREILLAHPVEPLIYRLRFGACDSIALVGVLELPARVRSVRALHVDEGDRLMVGTAMPDDFDNANVYVWPAQGW